MTDGFDGFLGSGGRYHLLTVYNDVLLNAVTANQLSDMVCVTKIALLEHFDIYFTIILYILYSRALLVLNIRAFVFMIERAICIMA